MIDPCDGWPWIWPSNGYRVQADREEPLAMEGFDHRSPKTVVSPLFYFLTRTDRHEWKYDLEWTLESGPPDVPAVVDILIPYDYRPGSPDSWYEPGDPPEVETGTPWYLDENGRPVEVSLIEAERDAVESHIHQNPPDDGYEPDYD